MNEQIEALKMAIEALKNAKDGIWSSDSDIAIQACREALAKAENQEPVACKVMAIDFDTEDGYTAFISLSNPIEIGTELYTHPASWQSLSDDEKWNLINNSDIPADYDHEVLAIAHAIDAKLKEKNHG